MLLRIDPDSKNRQNDPGSLGRRRIDPIKLKKEPQNKYIPMFDRMESVSCGGFFFQCSAGSNRFEVELIQIAWHVPTGPTPPKQNPSLFGHFR